MDDITFAWTITVTGILVVFVALVAVSLFVIVFQRIDQPKPTETPAVPQRSAPPTAKASSAPGVAESKHPAGGAGAGEGVSPEVMAVIVATVSQTLERPIRVHRIRYRAQATEAAWARQGRVEIMTSHRIRR
jgi:hypothetical protein